MNVLNPNHVSYTATAWRSLLRIVVHYYLVITHFDIISADWYIIIVLLLLIMTSLIHCYYIVITHFDIISADCISFFLVIAHYDIINTLLLPILTSLLLPFLPIMHHYDTCLPSFYLLLRNNRNVIAYYYICYYIVITYYYFCYYFVITYYYCNNGFIITVIMGLLLPIFTRSLIGNNGFIITYYEPDQLADDQNFAYQA